MASSKKLLLVEWDKTQTDIYAACLEEEGYLVTKLPPDPVDLLDEIKQRPVDIVITLAELKPLDICGVIERVRRLEKKEGTAFIALSTEEHWLDRLEAQDLAYFKRLPVSSGDLVSYVKWVIGEMKVDTEFKRRNGMKLDDLMLEIGIPSHLKGKDMLYTAVMLYSRNRIPDHDITTKLYPMVAAIYRCKKACVERNIRHALSKTYDLADPKDLIRYFGTTRPTNAQVISRLSELVRGWRRQIADEMLLNG